MSETPFFLTRGVVLVTRDIETLDWPTRAKAAGLTTIATHIFPQEIVDFLATDPGQRFLELLQADDAPAAQAMLLAVPDTLRNAPQRVELNAPGARSIMRSISSMWYPRFSVAALRTAGAATTAPTKTSLRSRMRSCRKLSRR